MTVAIFIYQHIYCRYLCPGECIIHDRGELCNKVAKILADKFNCSIRVISAGRPQANGQAEAYVKNLKTKMKAKMVEASQDRLPNNWDETLLHVALQALRCDPKHRLCPCRVASWAVARLPNRIRYGKYRYFWNEFDSAAC